MLEGHEARATAYALREPVAAGELQARFHRLGAAVAEERARQSRAGRQPRRHLALQRVVVEVRGVEQRLRPARRRARARPGCAVPEHRHADAREEVEVAPALDVVRGGCPRRARTPPAGACRSAARAALRAPGSSAAVVVMVVISLHPGPRSDGLAVRAPPAVRLAIRPSTIRTSRTPASRRGAAGRQLGDHAGARRARLHHRRRRRRVDHRHGGAGGVEHPGGVAGDDQTPAACSRAARLPASVSALTLNSAPAFEALTLATTGTKPRGGQPRQQRRAAASASASPTRPRLTVRAVGGGEERRRADRRHAGVGAGQADRRHAGGVERRRPGAC